jgi:hypothetical protein
MKNRLKLVETGNWLKIETGGYGRFELHREPRMKDIQVSTRLNNNSFPARYGSCADNQRQNLKPRRMGAASQAYGRD